MIYCSRSLRSHLPEILGRLWDGFAVETHDNPPEVLISMLNVEVYSVSDLGTLSRFCGLGKEHEHCS